jgi:hypothetical protein
MVRHSGCRMLDSKNELANELFVLFAISPSLIFWSRILMIYLARKLFNNVMPAYAPVKVIALSSRKGLFSS